MQVVLFDRDPALAKLLANTVTTRFPYVCAVSEDEAFAAIEADAAPSVLLVRWSSIAPYIRAFTLRWNTVGRGSLVVLLGPSELDMVSTALAHGADDVVLAPFSAQALLARLEVLAWRSRRSSKSQVAGVLRLALDHTDGGEVIIRASDDVARVFVVSGSVAWVQDPRDKRGFLETLHEVAPSLSREEFIAVLEESRQTKKHFGTILIEWGLMSREAFETGMARAIKARLDRVLAWPEAAAFFAPGQHSFTGTAVAVDSVIAARPRASNPMITAQPPSVLTADELRLATTYVQKLMAQTGVVGAAVFDETLAVCVAQKGEASEVEGAWSQINTLAAFGSDTVDSIVVRADRWFIARRSPSAPRLVIHAVFDSKQIMVGLARQVLIRVLSDE